MVRRFRAYLRKRRSDKFLKKHLCNSYKEYNRKYDPDINPATSYIENWYSGYRYVYAFDNISHTIYEYDTNGWDYDMRGLREVIQWCDDNCKGKYRIDEISSIKTEEGVYLISPFCSYGWGYDNPRHRFFAAFKDEKDYMWFILRWS